MTKAISEETALEVMERDNETCVLCRFLGTTPDHPYTLHHINYKSQGVDNSADNLITLCWSHHQDIHHGSLKKLLQEIFKRLIQ